MATATAQLCVILLALDDLPADGSVLDPPERRRAERLESPVDRHRFVAAHTALRYELAERLQIPAAALEFGRAACRECGAPHGRPVVLRPGGSLARRAGLHFSLSCSGPRGMIGIASAPVGVDIEALPPASMCRRLTALLDPRERALILSAPEPQQPMLFTRLWCRKEAYLKGLGAGFHHAGTERYLASPELTPGWRVSNVDAPPGFAGAVALATSGC